MVCAACTDLLTHEAHGADTRTGGEARLRKRGTGWLPSTDGIHTSKKSMADARHIDPDNFYSMPCFHFCMVYSQTYMRTGVDEERATWHTRARAGAHGMGALVYVCAMARR